MHRKPNPTEAYAMYAHRDVPVLKLAFVLYTHDIVSVQKKEVVSYQTLRN